MINLNPSYLRIIEYVSISDEEVHKILNPMKCKFVNLVAIAALSVAVSCAPQDQTNLLTPQVMESVHTEQAYPGQTGPWKTGYWLNNEVMYQSLNGEAIMDGDMVLHPHDLTDEWLPQPQTTGRTRTAAKWPNQTVAYMIDPSVPNQGWVTQAIAHWEAMTSIRFVQRTTERAFVRFRGGSGCSANVGRIGVEQYITIGPECSVGNIIHEIGHTVGLWHEQNRADRDNFVTVQTANIRAGAENNFQTYVQANYDGFDLGTAIDFGSIMMYSPYDFSSNGQPTITKKDGSLYSVQRNGLSAMDVSTVNAMYP
jgi:hypothetical protein